MNEVWKDIPDFGGKYQVSNLGKVRSVDRWSTHGRWGNGAKRFLKGRMLSQSVASTGYYVVGFRGKGNMNKREVHSLVALAFLGPRPAKNHVHHKNENKLDNRVSNLEYKLNGKHASEHNRGSKAANSKLTEKDVIKIRELLAKGVTQVELSAHYGVAQAHISTIKLRKSWRHI